MEDQFGAHGWCSGLMFAIRDDLQEIGATVSHQFEGDLCEGFEQIRRAQFNTWKEKSDAV